MITRAQGFFLVHKIVQQATQAEMLNTTINTIGQETLFLENNTKSFCLALIFALLTLLKQGYKSWGVTALPP
jgi:hypothetical protein